MSICFDRLVGLGSDRFDFNELDSLNETFRTIMASSANDGWPGERRIYEFTKSGFIALSFGVKGATFCWSSSLITNDVRFFALKECWWLFGD